MTGIRNLGAVLLAAAVVLFAGPASARSVGQVIDDTAITAEVKAKLVADTLSNLTRIEVTTQNGIVTLGGVVDDPERRARAAQIASGVGGVRGLVNNIHVAGTTVPPVASPPAGAPPVATTPPGSVPPAPGPPVVPGTATAPGMSVDTTGVIAHIDRANNTITLQDGRVVRVTGQTAVWQPIAIDALRPGTRVYVREAAAVAVQTAGTPLEWRMGTVRTVDRVANQLVLTDGTIVRMPPGAVLRRGSERLTIDQIVPGSEVVLRTTPRTASAEGSALPGTVVSTTVDAAELNVVWTPVNGAR